MDYEIKKKDSIYFLPTVEEWIFESFKLNLLEGILYKLILQQGSFVWTSEYTGKVLRVSGKTICRAVESLVKKEIIKIISYISSSLSFLSYFSESSDTLEQFVEFSFSL